MIPVTVVGGYLGAGKTTLINGLVSGDHGRRLAVLVNDFGAINIDARLIASHDGDTISLVNGCVCCTIADALGDALDKVLAMPVVPDHIVIEASGVANPAKIANYGQGWPGLRLDGIVVVADGESVAARAVDKFVGTTVRQQLAAADLLILNKVDLLSGGARQAARHWLARQAPAARIIAAARGRLPAAVLLGQHATGEPRGEPITAHDEFYTVPFQTSGAMDRGRLQRQIAAWPHEILRAKGLVYLRDDPDHAYILQRVGSRLHLERGPAWKAPARTQIVLISAARAIDPAWLAQSLLPALSPATSPSSSPALSPAPTPGLTPALPLAHDPRLDIARRRTR